MKRLLTVALLLVVLAAAAAAGLAWWGWERLHTPYQGYPGPETTITIEPGTGAGTILHRLEDEGVLEDARLARAWLIYGLEDPPLRAGEYRFEGPMTAPEVLDKLIRGDVVTYAVTLIEGQTLEEIADALDAADFGDRERFLEIFRSPALIADLDPEAPDLEGYLFPDTYRFTGGVDERDIAETLVQTFKTRWFENVVPLLETTGPYDADTETEESAPPPTVREVVTLASIVEKEARIDDERPVIAGVYRNRLGIGMGLQADPTVIYALKRRDAWDGNLRRPDLQIDSPYNTYRYPGLPPGPIAAPGLASLEAAAAPADVPYLYFVSRNDGTHVFAETYPEHQRNVNRWQKQYWRERWARERAAQQDVGEDADGEN